jgi:Uma2 family endonuclease
MELALPPDPMTLDRPMTVDEWLQLPDGPPYPELIDGELVVSLERHLLQHPPMLCVEVLSPSNRRHDLVRKRVAYERAAVASYWIIDLVDDDQPALRALDLVDGTYVERERPGGNEAPFTATQPFPVTIDPARLLD